MIEKNNGINRNLEVYGMSVNAFKMKTFCGEIIWTQSPLKEFLCGFSIILKGIEALNMVKKGQIKNLNYSNLDEVKYINQLFGIVLYWYI